MNTLKEPMNDSIRFFRNNIRWICLLILPIVLPLEILSVVMEYYSDNEDAFTSSYWLLFLLELLLHPIYQGALIFYIASVISNDRLPLKQYYQLAIKFWSPLFLLYVITNVVILAGLLLFIAPGLIAMSRLAFSEFYCLLHKQSALEAFSSSLNRTQEQQWLILSGIVIIYLLILLPYMTISYIIDSLALWNPLLSIIIGCSLSVLFSLVTIFSFRVYTLNPEDINK